MNIVPGDINSTVSSGGFQFLENYIYFATSAGTTWFEFDQSGAGYINLTGNVGIGPNLNPKAKLDVQGTISGALLTVTGLKSCDYITTTSAGVTGCGQNPTQTIVLSAGGALASVQSGATIKAVTFATNNVSTRVAEFGETGDRYAEWTATMPDSWDGGTMTAVFNWTTTAAANGIEWNVRCRSLGDNEAIDQSWGTAGTVADTAGTANTVRITSATSAITCAGTPAGGEIVSFQVFRDSADAQDTLSASGRLLSVKLEYTASSLTD